MRCIAFSTIGVVNPFAAALRKVPLRYYERLQLLSTRSRSFKSVKMKIVRIKRVNVKKL